MSEANETNSLKDIIQEFVLWKTIIKNKIVLFSLSSVIGITIGVAYAYFTPPTYNAELTFMMKTEGNPLTSSISSITSILGIGSGVTNGNPLEKVLDLISSNKIIGKSLLREVVINGKKDLLINHFIEIENLKQKWSKDTTLNKVKFENNIKYESLSRSQNMAIKEISEKISGNSITKNHIIDQNFEKKSGIVTISGVHKNEEIVVELINSIYQELINYYIEQTISSAERNVQILSLKVDSIRNELYSNQRQSAEQEDKSLGLLLQKDKVERKNLNIKEQVLIIMYGEALKNLETLRFLEASTTPAFTIIDQPTYPIKPQKTSKIKFAFLGMLIPTLVIFLKLRLQLLNNKIRLL